MSSPIPAVRCNGRSARSRPGPRLALLLLLLVPGAGGSSAAGPPGSSPAAADAAERARLARGEVLVRLAPVAGSAFAEGIARGVVEAPPERVFRAITDYLHYEEFMPYVERSSAEPQPDGSVVSAQLLDLPAPLSDRSFRVRFRQRVEPVAGGRLWHAGWTYVPGSGNVADQHGSWTLAEIAPNRTLVTCRIYLDPGGAVPARLLNRTTGRSLPWILDGLRQQVRRSRYDAP